MIEPVWTYLWTRTIVVPRIHDTSSKVQSPADLVEATVASRHRVDQAFISAPEYVHLLKADVFVWRATPLISDRAYTNQYFVFFCVQNVSSNGAPDQGHVDTQKPFLSRGCPRISLPVLLLSVVPPWLRLSFVLTQLEHQRHLDPAQAFSSLCWSVDTPTPHLEVLIY
jgi:hypothetical protein